MKTIEFFGVNYAPFGDEMSYVSMATETGLYAAGPCANKYLENITTGQKFKMQIVVDDDDYIIDFNWDTIIPFEHNVKV